MIGAFLASGALGYILANIYFGLYWSPIVKGFIAIDHLSLLRNLESAKIIDIVDEKDNKRDIKNKRDAWNIITQFWHARVENDDQIRGINRITDRLTDITHALGATCLGTIIGLIIWIGFHLSNYGFGFCIKKVVFFLDG